MTSTVGQLAASASSALNELQEDRSHSHHDHLCPERAVTSYLKMKKQLLKYLLHIVLVTTLGLEILSNKMFSNICFSNREGNTV